jgi:1-acyl-sn-glycerol-3-phosphate acyltransferase
MTSAEKGVILKWLHRGNAARWGTSPDDFDARAVEGTLARLDRVLGPGRYFGLDVRGWENVPSEPPAMLVSNHSGGTTIPDVWGLIGAWYRRFGTARPLHPMAHEMVLSNRVTGPFFAARGVLRGSQKLAHEVIGTWRRDLLVMPGGDRDTWRPYWKRYKVEFAGRVGYARVAIQAGVPIVPVAHAGAHETLLVLTDGRAIARLLRLKELARAEIFPIHLSLPWGLGIGPLPHIPIPVRLRYAIGPAIAPPAHANGGEPREEDVRALDAEVRRSVQHLLDELAREGR